MPLIPDPAGRAYSAPPDPQTVLKGPTSKVNAREGGGAKKGKGEERGEDWGGIWSTQKLWRPL